MANFIDLSGDDFGADDFKDMSKISSVIGKNYSDGKIDTRTSLSRTSAIGGGDFTSSATEYKVATTKLTAMVVEITRQSKKILAITANTVNRVFSNINSELQLSGSKMLGATLIKISPALSFIAMKIVETGIFKTMFEKIKNKTGEAIKSIFKWIGVDPNAKVSFKSVGMLIMGLAKLPFKLLGDVIVGFAKLPFKSLGLLIKTTSSVMGFLAQLPWKLLTGSITMLVKAALLPVKLLAGIAKLPFKMLGGIFGAMGLKSAQSGGFVTKQGPVNVHAGELIIPDKKLNEIFDPMKKDSASMAKSLKHIALILAGLTVGILGVKGMMGGMFKGAILGTGIGSVAAAGYTARSWFKDKFGTTEGAKNAAYGAANQARGMYDKVREPGFASSMFAGFFGDEGAMGKMRQNMKETSDHLLNILKREDQKSQRGESTIVINPLTNLTKSETAQRAGRLFKALENALTAVEESTEQTISGAVEETYKRRGPMPKGLMKRIAWLTGMGLGTGRRAGLRLGGKAIGTSFRAVGSILKMPFIGPEAALNQFADKTRMASFASEVGHEKNIARDAAWKARFSKTDKFFQDWEKMSKGLDPISRFFHGIARTIGRGAVGTVTGTMKWLGISAGSIGKAFQSVFTDTKTWKGLLSGLLMIVPMLLKGVATLGLGGLAGGIIGLGKGLNLGGIGGGLLDQFWGDTFDLTKPGGKEKLGRGARLKRGLKGIGRVGGTIGKGLLGSPIGKIGTAYGMMNVLGEGLGMGSELLAHGNIANYTKGMTGKDTASGVDQTIVGITSLISGGQKEGGIWGGIKGALSGTAIGGFPWGTLAGGLIGLIGVNKIIKAKDWLGSVGSDIGIGVYDFIHTKTGFLGGLKAFMAVISAGGSIGSAMYAFGKAYGAKDSEQAPVTVAPNKWAGSGRIPYSIAQAEGGGRTNIANLDPNPKAGYDFGAYQMNMNKAVTYVQKNQDLVRHFKSSVGLDLTDKATIEEIKADKFGKGEKAQKFIQGWRMMKQTPEELKRQTGEMENENYIPMLKLLDSKRKLTLVEGGIKASRGLGTQLGIIAANNPNFWQLLFGMSVSGEGIGASTIHKALSVLPDQEIVSSNAQKMSNLIGSQRKKDVLTINKTFISGIAQKEGLAKAQQAANTMVDRYNREINLSEGQFGKPVKGVPGDYASVPPEWAANAEVRQEEGKTKLTASETAKATEGNNGNVTVVAPSTNVSQTSSTSGGLGGVGGGARQSSKRQEFASIADSIANGRTSVNR